jgi:hypothetical protein
MHGDEAARQQLHAMRNLSMLGVRFRGFGVVTFFRSLSHRENAGRDQQTAPATRADAS